MKLVKSLLIPYLKRFWLMLLSVILVGGFGSAILIGLRNAYYSVSNGVNTLIEECGYPDLYIQTIGDIESSYISLLPSSFNEDAGIEKAEYRTTYTTTFEKDSVSYSTRLIGYTSESMLTHHLIEGELKEDGVRVDYYFAKANGIKVNDTIKTKLPNGTIYDLKVDATIVSPETSIVKADPYAISSSRDFAYIYIPKSILIDNSPKATFNQILIKFKEGEKKNLDESVEFLKAYVKEKQGIVITEDDIKMLKANIAYATTYEDSEVIKYYKDAVNGINLITLSAPTVFFVVVLIVSALFLFQIVKQCRKDIGIMRALGEKTSSISLVFLSLGLITGVLAWLIGIGIGSIFTLLANEAYGGALKLYPLSFHIELPIIFIALGIVVFVTLLTSLLASLNITRIKPVEAMKALPPTKNETPLLTRTLFKNAPITLKVSISQSLRNLSRYIMSGICLLSSAMLIFVALAINESKATMMSQLFNTRLDYDVQVYFDNMPSDSDIDNVFLDTDTNILDKTLIKYLPSELVNPTNNKKAVGLINGLKEDQKLVKVVDDYEHTIDINKEGIVLSTYHAYLLDAKVGDIVNANDTPLKVTAISNEYMYQVSYTDFDSYNPEYTRGSLLAKVNDEQEFFEKYKDASHVTYISFTKVIKAEFNERLSAFEISAAMLTFMSIVIGFMIVFNMMQTNLKEQKRTFATMRTLGFQRIDISLSNLFTSIIQYLVSMTFAIPLGILLGKTLLKAISLPDQIFPFPKTVTMYVFSTLIVLAFLLISHYLVMNTMKKWNLPESVKERE